MKRSLARSGKHGTVDHLAAFEDEERKVQIAGKMHA